MFICVFFTKMTCSFLLQENKSIIRIKHILKNTRFSILFNSKRFQGYCCKSAALSSFHGEFVEIMLTVPSIKIGNKNMKHFKSKQNFVLKGIESLPQIQIF